MWFRVLLFLEHVHRFVDLEDLAAPLSLVNGLTQQRVDGELTQNFQACIEHLVVNLFRLPQSKTIVQSSHL